MKQNIRSMRALASKLAKLEGKKSQAEIGNIRELLGILSDMIYKDPWVGGILFCNGEHRSNKKKKKRL